MSYFNFFSTLFEKKRIHLHPLLNKRSSKGGGWNRILPPLDGNIHPERGSVPRTGSLRVVPLDGNEAGDRSIERASSRFRASLLKIMAPLKNCFEARSRPISVSPLRPRDNFEARMNILPLSLASSRKNVRKMGEITFRNFPFLFSNLLKTRLFREREGERELLLLLVSTLPSSRYRRVIC